MRSWTIRISAAAVIAVAALVGVGLFFRGTVTFAEVIEPILNARTVALDIIAGEEEKGPVMHDVVVGKRIRRTFSNMETTMIIDLDSAKMLTLDPLSKTAAVVNIEGPLQEGTRSYIGLVRNIVNDVNDNPDLPVEQLGRRKIDGRRAVGFLLKDKDVELKIWADPKTALPMRIELLLGRSYMILKNIQFDVPVNDSQVSMEPPTGYKLGAAEFDMRDFTEQDFIESLRLMAQHVMNGSFPESLSLQYLMTQTPVVGEKIGKLDLPDEQKAQLGMKFGRGFVFFQMVASRGEWHYVGKGVTLGDAGKAIFWYQPKGSETYRVVYGDLSVRDVAAENLPK